MATKILVNIKLVTIQGNGSTTLSFELDISDCENPSNREHNLAFRSSLSKDDTKLSINNAIIAFVKTYTENNWGTRYQPLDVIKIVNSVDDFVL